MQNFTPTVNFMHLVDHWNSMDYCAVKPSHKNLQEDKRYTESIEKEKSPEFKSSVL